MRRGFLFALKLAVSGALLYILYRNTPLERIAELALDLDGAYLLPICLLLFVNTMISARKWQLFLRADKVDISLKELTLSYMSGTFCNLFLPSNIGGDSYRIYDIARQSRRAVSSAASVFADRLSGFVALVLLSVVSSFFVALKLDAPRFMLIPSLLLAGFAIILLLLANRGPVDSMIRISGLGRFGYLVGLLDKFYASIDSYGADRWLIVKVMALSFAFQASLITVVFLMARSLGADTPFYYFGAFVPLITMMEALPISIYGIGVRDYGYVFFFTQVGMGPIQTRTLALLFMVTAICYSLLGGLFFLYKLWAKPRQE